MTDAWRAGHNVRCVRDVHSPGAISPSGGAAADAGSQFVSKNNEGAGSAHNRRAEPASTMHRSSLTFGKAA
jgi:hypothetical protein